VRALLIKAPGHVEIEDVDMPELPRDSVLVRVRASGLCGTDIDIYSGKFAWELPTRVGHEFAGEVVEGGADVDRFAPGDRVVGENCIGCGKCPICRSGRYNLCERMPQLFDAHAEYTVSPERATFRLPDSVSFEQGALVEPLCTGFRAAMLADVGAGSTVAIIGDGGIGLSATICCREMGAARILITGHRESRMRLARQLGAEQTIDAGRENIVASILDLTDGLGADSTIVTVGAQTMLGEVISLTKRGGSIAILGLYHGEEPPTFEWNDIILREPTIRGNFSSPNVWPTVIEMLGQGRFPDATKMITHRFALDEAKQAFEVALDKSQEAIKIMLTQEA
jgi:threonine dehydrogenase-like Zn-dependent dehydrogenase